MRNVGRRERNLRVVPGIQAPVKRLLCLIVEVEQPEGLSSRKLIIESMKHNVVTAYSGVEALELLSRMRPDIVLAHSDLRAPSCAEFLKQVRGEFPTMPLVVTSPRAESCSIEDYVVNSLEPAQLVGLIKKLSQQMTGAQPMEHSTTRVIGAGDKE